MILQAAGSFSKVVRLLFAYQAHPETAYSMTAGAVMSYVQKNVVIHGRGSRLYLVPGCGQASALNSKLALTALRHVARFLRSLVHARFPQ